MTISFTVSGIPKAQPRPRAFARKFGDKYQARVYDAGTAEAWKSDVALAARPHLPASPLSGPLAFTVRFIMPRIKSHYRTGKRAGELREDAPTIHQGKPDFDNLCKSTMDALTQIGLWRDDGQIARAQVEKVYGDRPGAEIHVEAIDLGESTPTTAADAGQASPLFV